MTSECVEIRFQTGQLENPNGKWPAGKTNVEIQMPVEPKSKYMELWSTQVAESQGTSLGQSPGTSLECSWACLNAEMPFRGKNELRLNSKKEMTYHKKFVAFLLVKDNVV